MVFIASECGKKERLPTLKIAREASMRNIELFQPLAVFTVEQVA